MKIHSIFDSLIYRFFSRIADLIILNILCILCCLPIITAGASVTAMFYVTLRMVRKQDAYIVKDFFHSFRQNLKQGILIHLIFSVITIILGLDVYVMWKLLDFGIFYKWMFVVLLLVSLLHVVTYLYIYPVLAQFDNTIRGLIKSARFMALKHFSYTIMFLLITVSPIVAGCLIPNALEWEILILLVIGFAGITYIHSHFFVVIFDKYINEDNKNECLQNE